MQDTPNWEKIDFTIYFSFLKWPVILAIVLELFLRSWAWYQVGIVSDNLDMLVWLVRLLILTVIGWRVIKNFGGHTAVAAMAGALAGLQIGLVVSVSRLLGGLQVWKIFNIVTETTVLAVIGSLMAIAITFIFTDRRN